MSEMSDYFESYVRQNLHDEQLRPMDTDKTGERRTFIVPMTYITPNYLAINMFSIMAALTRLGHRVILFIHDTNLLSHKRNKARADMTYLSITQNIEHIVEEVETLFSALSADIDNVRIIKASDAWEKIIKNRIDFLIFFNMLSDLNLGEKPSDRKFYRKMHHLFQRPFDIFFAKSCSRLYNIEINGAPIIITSEDRFEYYKRFRDALVTNSELTGSTENCLEFSITRQVPYLDFREALPGCNTGREEIYAILYNSKHTFHDIMLLRQNLIDPLSGYLERTGVMRKRIALKDSSDLHAVSESLNEILYSIKTASHNTSVPTNKEMVIDSKARIDEFVSLFNSKATGAILKFCTGEITESEIAKATGMRLSNVSAHFKKMRAFGIVTSEKKPKIKIKRITLNLNYLQ